MNTAPNDDRTYTWFDGTYGDCNITLTMDQAESCAHAGQCDADVLDLSRLPAVAADLAAITPESARRCLKEYGAWDADELADHDQNLQRLLWLAANDITEQPQVYAND